MNNLKAFFGNFSKSTRITVISCGIFVILTFFILMFFVIFPITPSEKVISGMGRNGLSYSDNSENSSDNVVVTTASSQQENEAKLTTVTKVTHAKTHYTDKIFTENEPYVYTGYTAAIPREEYIYKPKQTVTEAVNNYVPPKYTEPVYSETEPTVPPTSESSEYEPTEPSYSEEPTEPSYEEPTEPPYEEPTDPPYEEPTEPPYEEPTEPPYEEPTEPPAVVDPEPVAPESDDSPEPQ